MLDLIKKMIYNKSMAKYSIHTLSEKEAIVDFYQKNGWDAVFKKYKTPRATLARWVGLVKHADPSDTHPLARRRLIRPETVAFVKQYHKKHPELSLEQLRRVICKEKQKISRTTIWHILNDR